MHSAFAGDMPTAVGKHDRQQNQRRVYHLPSRSPSNRARSDGQNHMAECPLRACLSRQDRDCGVPGRPGRLDRMTSKAYSAVLPGAVITTENDGFLTGTGQKECPSGRGNHASLPSALAQVRPVGAASRTLELARRHAPLVLRRALRGVGTAPFASSLGV